MLIEIKGYAKSVKHQFKKNGTWWYEWRQGKPKWKASMMFMDVIHVHVEEGKEHGKVKGQHFH